MDPLQLLFSPVFGFLANKFRSIRAITLAACITYVGGNIIYSTLSLFPYDARYYMLLVCRFMVGISTGRLRGCSGLFRRSGNYRLGWVDFYLIVPPC